MKKLAGPFRRSAAASSKPGIDTLFHVSRLSKPFANLLDAHYRAQMDYVPRPYPGPVTLFRARAQGLSLTACQAIWAGAIPPPGRVETHVIPGSHDNMLHAPFVRTLAERLRAALEVARRQEQEKNGRIREHPFTAVRGVDGRRACGRGVYKVVLNEQGQYFDLTGGSRQPFRLGRCGPEWNEG